MDIPKALRSLDLCREDDVPDLGWLAASYEDPPAFWSALAEHARRLAPPPRSRPTIAYDLFYDAIGRYAQSTRTALLAHDRRTGFTSLSYAELAARASACAKAWATSGVTPGKTLALVLPLGVDWLVAFAAALRLGLVVSFLAVAGAHALLPRLAALDPAYVLFDEAAPFPLGPFAERALVLVTEGPPHAAPPYAYAPSEPCARLFSPLCANLLEPVELEAEVAYQNALRDAVFVYRLAEGDALALPGFHPQQHYPAALFSTLLAGATFVHIPFASLVDDPALLKEQPITVLGMTPALCERVRAKPIGPLPALRHWIKSVDEPLDWLCYHEFVKKNDLVKVPVSNVFIDAARGGALLWSTRRPGSVNAYALAAPGRPYALFDASSGEPLSGAGVFVPVPGKDPKKDGFFLLARRSLNSINNLEYLWGSTLSPRRAGRVFPAAEVTARVAELPGIEGACVVPVPTFEPGARWAFVLLVFTGTRRAIHAEALEAQLRVDLGEDFLPDRITVLPLYPHKKGDKVDASWCRRQYSSGFLARKANHPAYRSLTTLRGLLLGA